MLGLMQSQPLLISSLIEFAERHHGDAEIVSRRVEGDIHRYTYRDLARRARQLANVLDGMELQFSDRVATLAWNGYRHMEMYFGVSGSGRVPPGRGRCNGGYRLPPGERRFLHHRGGARQTRSATK